MACCLVHHVAKARSVRHGSDVAPESQMPRRRSISAPCKFFPLLSAPNGEVVLRCKRISSCGDLEVELCHKATTVRRVMLLARHTALRVNRTAGPDGITCVHVGKTCALLLGSGLTGLAAWSHHRLP